MREAFLTRAHCRPHPCCFCCPKKSIRATAGQDAPRRRVSFCAAPDQVAFSYSASEYNRCSWPERWENAEESGTQYVDGGGDDDDAVFSSSSSQESSDSESESAGSSDDDV